MSVACTTYASFCSAATTPSEILPKMPFAMLSQMPSEQPSAPLPSSKSHLATHSYAHAAPPTQSNKATAATRDARLEAQEPS